MKRISQRAKWPSFLLFPAFLFAVLTSILASYFNYWSGITCLLLLLCFGLPEKIIWSYLTIAIITFVSVLLGNLIFIDVAYTSRDFYYIAYFVIGFIVFSQLAIAQIMHTYKLLVYFFVFLSIWAIFQYYTGEFYIFIADARSNTIFTTPNTFAAAINLILFPLIATSLYKKNRPVIFSLMLLLFYVLLLTRSRGGLVSFSLGFCAICLFTYISKINKKINWLNVIIGLTSVFLLFLFSQLYDWQSNRKHSNFGLLEATRMGEMSAHIGHRLVLYDVAWERIKEKPLLGHGYNNYQFYWLKDQKPPFRNNITRFVHNDYLQLWMETGIVGLITFLSIIILFYYQVWCRHKSVDEESIPVLLALVGGLTAYFAHAMVDFVVYPCFLALLFGAYLGTSIRYLNIKAIQTNLINVIENKFVRMGWNRKFWRIFLAVILIGLLSQPYIADLAFKRAEKYASQGNIEASLPYYEIARQFAPYIAYYYVLEGSYWRLAVMQEDRPNAAERADKLFEAGARSNPFDVNNVLSRALLHRDYPNLLSSPADSEKILEWFEHVLYWRPRFVAGQIEHVRTLYQIGQKKKAKEMFEKYIIINPGSEKLLKLRDELRI